MAKITNPSFPGRFSLQVLVDKEVQPEAFHGDDNLVVLPTDVDYELLVSVPLGEWQVVVSVDGLDVIDGEHRRVDECRGYIMRPKNAALEPTESGNFIDGNKVRRIIRGYRIDNTSVAKFRTGKRQDSYAAKLGKAQNTGVIGIAFFAGYTTPPPAPKRALESCEESTAGGGFESGGADKSSIGTAFGSRVEDRVRSVDFTKTAMVGMIEILYDSAQALSGRGLAFSPPGPEDSFQFHRARPNPSGCAIPPGWKG